MPKLQPTKSKELVRVLKKIGFFEFRIKGSHLIMKNDDNLLVVTNAHRERNTNRNINVNN
ncbi:MAG: type II toxin-antitoxin system HicA family toxin [bacterium]